MTFPKPRHRHTSCSSRAKKRLDNLSKARSKRLGVNDKWVFDILLSEHRPFSAYEIAEQIAHAGKPLQAIQVYRAVETLINLGVAHRVALKNGYMACHSPDKCAAQQILICSSCNQVAELEHSKLNATITSSIKECGFVPERQKLELLGLCPNCADGKSQK